MVLIKYNDPFRSSNPFRDLEELFEESFRTPLRTLSQTSLNTPVSDIYMDEGEENLVIEAQLPGFEEENVDVSVENGVLSIRAEHQEKETDKKKGRKYVVQESSSSFYRQVGLPKNADADKISAHFEDGILKVNVPMKELPKPKKVTISGNKGKKKIVGKK